MILDVLLLVILGYFISNFYLRKLPEVSETKLASEQTQTEAKQVAQICQNNPSWHECYKTEMPKLAKTYGLKTGEEILSALQDIDPNSRNCHVIAHFMAREAMRREPNKFHELFDSLDVNACGSGFLHGVLETYLGLHPEVKVDGKFASEICDRGNDLFRKRMCAHFVGHIFLLNEEGNLSQALASCTGIKTEWLYDCYDGMFMEDHQKLALSEHGISPLPDLTDEYTKGLEQECQKHSDIQAAACWTEMAEMYAHKYGYVPDIVYKNCEKAPEQYRKSCYGKGVVAISIYTGFDTQEQLKSICRFYEANIEDYKWCVSSMVSSFMYYSPKFTERGITLCSNIQNGLQEWCFENLGSALKNIVSSPADRENFCRASPEKFRHVCATTN